MKDYKKLEERINKEKEITIGDITDLGYSRYDINLFIASGIIKRSKRGIYLYLPTIENITENHSVELATEQLNGAYYFVNEGIRHVIKRRHEEALESFDKALEIETNNSRAILGKVGVFVFTNNYDQAYQQLLRFYNTRKDNSLIYNVYYYLLLLKEHIDINDNLLAEINSVIEEENSTIKRINRNFKGLHSALDHNDYLEALKYINYSISFDKKERKYHITNHIYKSLIISILKLKGINPFPNNQIVGEQTIKEETTIVEEQQSSDVIEEQILVPEIKDDVIKTNLLLEAINNNDYGLAISLLEQYNIENPIEVIKQLLTKLFAIQSLINTKEPIKVLATEEVTLIQEECLEESIHVENPSFEETPIIENPQTETPTSLVVDPSIEEPTKIELANIAYKAYKDAFHTQQFDEAYKQLRRYEYLNNANGNTRNLNYHYIRIERNKKDYEANPERYLNKKALASKIFELKRARRFDVALAAIAEYKTLGGIIDELVILVEAEIYLAFNNLSKVHSILKSINTCEEPTYFILSSKLYFKNYRFQEALEYCQAFNERRPHKSPANYQLMGDCYSKLRKPGKAIKAYRKAEEIATQYGYTPIDLSSKISQQEMRSELNKEDRATRYLEKRK